MPPSCGNAFLGIVPLELLAIPGVDTGRLPDHLSDFGSVEQYYFFDEPNDWRRVVLGTGLNGERLARIEHRIDL